MSVEVTCLVVFLFYLLLRVVKDSLKWYNKYSKYLTL